MQSNQMCSTEKSPWIMDGPLGQRVFKISFLFVQMGFRLIRAKISRGRLFSNFLDNYDLTNRISEFRAWKRRESWAGNQWTTSFNIEKKVTKYFGSVD
jgi:hypothetical protein